MSADGATRAHRRRDLSFDPVVSEGTPAADNGKSTDVFCEERRPTSLPTQSALVVNPTK